MKILLIADVHNKPHGSKKTLHNLKGAINRSGCDLIVFLGDTVHGPATKNNYEHYLRQVLDLTGDIPFAAVFGNHDDECKTIKAEILSMMKKYPNCLAQQGDYVLELMGQTLAFVDSGSYYDGEGSFYDTVKPEQTQYILSKIKGKGAILFQHIIVPDIMDVIDKYDKRVKGAVRDGRHYFKFRDGISYTGRLGEAPCPPDINTNELSTLAPHLRAMCFGHDHKNTFELELMGVKLIQCGGCGSNSYDKYSLSSVKLLDTDTLQTTLIRL